jgi:hypothetical protein
LFIEQMLHLRPCLVGEFLQTSGELLQASHRVTQRE